MRAQIRYTVATRAAMRSRRSSPSAARGSSQQTYHGSSHAVVTSTHERYGAVSVTAWGHYHPQLQRRAGWATHPGRLPLVQGSLILVRVDRLPGDRAPKPVWLWHSHPEAADLDVRRAFGDHQRFGNLAIGTAARQEPGDFAFPPRQIGR